MDIKKLRSFVDSYFLEAFLIVGMLLIVFSDSPILGVLVYGIVIHLITLLVVITILSDDVFDPVYDKFKEKYGKMSGKKIIFNRVVDLIKIIIYTAIMVLTNHLYLVIITLMASGLAIGINVVAYNKLKEERKNEMQQ